jgi:hypothetical protein
MQRQLVACTCICLELKITADGLYLQLYVNTAGNLYLYISAAIIAGDLYLLLYIVTADGLYLLLYVTTADGLLPVAGKLLL